MSASNVAENLILDSCLGTNHGSLFPANVEVALYTTDPTDAGTGTEASGGSYAPVVLTNNSTNWPDASSSTKTNGVAINFPTATGSWGTCTHWAIRNSVSHVVLFSGALSSTIAPVTGNTPSIGIGLLDISCD